MKGEFKIFEKHDCQNVTKNGSMEPLNSVKNDLQIVSIYISGKAPKFGGFCLELKKNSRQCSSKFVQFKFSQMWIGLTISLQTVVA